MFAKLQLEAWFGLGLDIKVISYDIDDVWYHMNMISCATWNDNTEWSVISYQDYAAWYQELMLS
jgi:hypothetical protein